MRHTYSLKTVTFLTAVVIVAVLSSCNKEETGKVLFTATIENSAKTTISINDVTETGTLAWEQGDRITVFDGNGAEATLSATTAGTTSGFTLDDGQTEPTTAPYTAIYNYGGSVTNNTITIPITQNWNGSSVKAPMYAPYTNSTELEFKNLCGIMVLTLDAPSSGSTHKKVTDIEITADKPLCGSFLINAEDYSMRSLDYNNSRNYSIALVCGNGVSIQGSENFYIYLPPATYSSMTITINTNDGMVCTKTLRNTFTVERNCYYPFSFRLSPVGGINGLFTVGVNADNSLKQVWFSRGNLQYRASTNSWRFANYQYDYVGEDNENNSNSYSGWIDLFGWGTGDNPTLTSTDYHDYNNFVDWGSNPIFSGGNLLIGADLWRTLSVDEWNYLFNTRSLASSLYGTGSVCGKGGLIILPDGWTTPDGCSFTSGFSTYGTDVDWSRNSYHSAQWEKMEAAGAVFLPAAGGGSIYDGMISISGNGERGYYWSSTNYGGTAGCVPFASYRFWSFDYWGKEQRHSVRLVRNN